MNEPGFTTTPPAIDVASITLSVVAPCYNEQENVDALVDRTLAVFDQMGTVCELVLVDDGSRDATWAKISKRAEIDDRVRGVKLDRNGGIEAAWRTGVTVAEGHLICLIDADLQNRPEDIPLLYKAYLREVPDMVQAVRHATVEARQRRLFSRGLNFLLNVAFGMNLKDNKSGFILARRDAMSTLLEHKYAYRYYQSVIGCAAGANGFLSSEVDTTFDARMAGKSFLPRFPLTVSARIVWELIKFRYETWMADGAARDDRKTIAASIAPTGS